MDPQFIPIVATSFGALTGGMVTMAVTFLSNRHALQRQKWDLEHQASQKEKERQHALKRDVYLPLTEATAAAIGFLGGSAGCTSEELRKMEPVNRLSGLVARTVLVAPREVVEPIQTGMRALAKLAMAVQTKRIPIDVIDDEIADVETALRSASGDAVSVLLEKKVKLATQKARLIMKLSREIISNIPRISRHSTTALVAIRRDLGFDPDAEWLMEMFERHTAEVIEAAEVEMSQVAKLAGLDDESKR